MTDSGRSRYVHPNKYDIAARHSEVSKRLDRRSVRVGDCIEWQGALSSEGYGTLVCNKQHVYAHRLAWWLRVGPIPQDLVVDHLCHNRKCLNIQHLAIVTVEENSRRYPRALSTHCGQGHPLSGENLRVHLDSKRRPHRHCRECGKIRARNWHQRQKAASRPIGDPVVG
jgi:hypothetical protein